MCGEKKEMEIDVSKSREADLFGWFATIVDVSSRANEFCQHRIMSRTSSAKAFVDRRLPKLSGPAPIGPEARQVPLAMLPMELLSAVLIPKPNFHRVDGACLNAIVICLPFLSPCAVWIGGEGFYYFVRGKCSHCLNRVFCWLINKWRT